MAYQFNISVESDNLRSIVQFWNSTAVCNTVQNSTEQNKEQQNGIVPHATERSDAEQTKNIRYYQIRWNKIRCDAMRCDAILCDGAPTAKRTQNRSNKSLRQVVRLHLHLLLLKLSCNLCPKLSKSGLFVLQLAVGQQGKAEERREVKKKRQGGRGEIRNEKK